VAKELAYIKIDGATIFVAGVTSIILIMSSVMFHKSHSLWKKNKEATISNYFYVSIIFGIVFLIGQINLWKMIVNAGFTSHSNVLAGMVYLIGGVHAVHLIAGLSVLGWLWYQLIQSRQVKPVRYQLIGWFWHFLTALWCIIFIFFVIIL